MKWKFRIVKETKKSLMMDNETIMEKSVFYVQQRDLIFWETLYDESDFYVSEHFGTYDEAMDFLLGEVRRMWKNRKRYMEEMDAEKRFKKKLKPTKVVVGKITFTEEDLDRLLEKEKQTEVM